MNPYEYIKHISHEDFKKLDINLISYVQLYNGEILMIDHPYLKDQNNLQINKEEKNYLNNDKKQQIENTTNTKKRKRKKNKNKNKKKDNISPNIDTNKDNNYLNKYMDYSPFSNNYDNYKYDANYSKYDTKKEEAVFTLPDQYFEPNPIVRSISVLVKNKGRILFNEEWKDLQDYNFNERIKFYDSIPKRAKFWERESYDSTRSLFQSKRLDKMKRYNLENHFNYNYAPIPKESFSEGEYEEDTYHNESLSQINNNKYEQSSNNFPLNLVTNQKDLYNLVFGPKISQYIFGQQQNNVNSGYEYSKNNNYNNYYQTMQFANYNQYNNENNYDYYYEPYFYQGIVNNNSIESKKK